MAQLKGLETATPLLVAYESLALAHKKAKNKEKYLAEGDGRPANPYVNYRHGLALLVINASIIEGTLRSILSAKVLLDLDRATKHGIKAGQTAPKKTETLLRKFLNEVQHDGGWEKLKKQYLSYLSLPFDDIVEENTGEAINALFVLRNVITHGTAIIAPTAPVDETARDEHQYRCQQKLERASVHLERTFHKGNLFENLSEYAVPQHFMEETKVFFSSAETHLPQLPERARKTIDMVQEYQFGYTCYFDSTYVPKK